MQTFSKTKWQVQSSWLINDDIWVDPGSGGQVPCSFIYSPTFWPHGQWTRTHWAAWGVTESHQYNRLQNLQTFLHDSPPTPVQVSMNLSCQNKKAWKDPGWDASTGNWHLWSLSKVLIFSALLSDHLRIEINHYDKMWFFIVSIARSHSIFTDGVERICIIHVHVRLS